MSDTKEFVVSGTRVVGMEATGRTLEEAVAAYRESHRGCVPDYFEEVGGERHGSIIGLCEGCERPILEGEKYGRDEDGTCYECPACLAEDERHHEQQKARP